MPVDLNWLDSTGWLYGEKATVKIPQSVLQELVAEVREQRGESAKDNKKEPTVKDMEMRLIALHVAAQEEGKENPELKWATGYSLVLLKACQELLFHLRRLSDSSFQSRTKLEAAMRGGS